MYHGTFPEKALRNRQIDKRRSAKKRKAQDIECGGGESLSRDKKTWRPKRQKIEVEIEGGPSEGATKLFHK